MTAYLIAATEFRRQGILFSSTKGKKQLTINLIIQESKLRHFSTKTEVNSSRPLSYVLPKQYYMVAIEPLKCAYTTMFLTISS